jgi:hypothetical protein
MKIDIRPDGYIHITVGHLWWKRSATLRRHERNYKSNDLSHESGYYYLDTKIHCGPKIDKAIRQIQTRNEKQEKSARIEAQYLKQGKLPRAKVISTKV